MIFIYSDKPVITFKARKFLHFSKIKCNLYTVNCIIALLEQDNAEKYVLNYMNNCKSNKYNVKNSIHNFEKRN